MFAGSNGIEYPSELSFFLKLEDDIVNRPIEIVDGYIDLESLATITIDEQRLKLTWIGASEGVDFAKTIKEMVEEVSALGPNQTREQMVL